MMRHRVLLVAAVSFGMVGCTVRPGSLVSLPVTTAGAPAVSAAQPESGAEQAQLPASEYGTLSLTVRWPERPTGYQTALIPTSTNTLVIKVSSGSTEVASASVTRQAGASTATANVPLKAGNNLSVEVLAYREAAPVPEGAEPTARGTANVNITRSRKTSAGVSLTPLFVPTITALSTNTGVPGDEVTITGTNFATDGTPVQVYFNGYITGAVPTSSTSVKVTVPPGTPTGKVVVKSDGVSSDSNFVFWVPKTVTLTGNKKFWDPSPSDSQIVILGKEEQLFYSVNWETKTGDNIGYFGAPPSPTWHSSDESAGTVDESGVFTAGGSYVAAGTNVTAQFGSLVSAPLKIVPEAVSVSVRPIFGQPTLGGKGGFFFRIDAENVFSDGATNSFVDFSADASASVDVTGRVTATDFGSKGTIKVTVSSAANSSQQATVNLQLDNYNVTTFAGDGVGGMTNGDALASRFKRPQGMAFDRNGNLYVADWENGAIRRISGGTVSTVALSGLDAFRPYGLAYFYDTANSLDWLYVSDNVNHKVYRIQLTAGGTTGSGTVLAGSGSQGMQNGAGVAAQFNRPMGIAVDGDRNVFVADEGNSTIRKIDGGGMVSSFVGSPHPEFAPPISRDGLGSDPSAGAKFVHPTGLTIDNQGTLYVTQMNDGKIRRVSRNALVDTLLLTKSLWNPVGIAVGPGGTLFVTEENTNSVHKIFPQGEVVTIAGGSGNLLLPSLKDGIGTKADLRAPNGIVRANDGSLYVTEYTNNAIRKLD